MKSPSHSRHISTVFNLILAVFLLGSETTKAQEIELFGLGFQSHENLTVTDPSNFAGPSGKVAVSTRQITLAWPIEILSQRSGIITGFHYLDHDVEFVGTASSRQARDRVLNLELTSYLEHPGKIGWLALAVPSLEIGFDRPDSRTRLNLVLGVALNSNQAPGYGFNLGLYYILSRGRNFFYPLVNARYSLSARFELKLDSLGVSEFDCLLGSGLSTGLHGRLSLDGFRIPPNDSDTAPVSGQVAIDQVAIDLNLDTFELGVYLRYETQAGMAVSFEAGTISVVGHTWLDADNNPIHTSKDEAPEPGQYLRMALYFRY